MEFWTSTPAAPRGAAEFARGAEQSGWHGMTTVDSQNLSGDPYVCLALGATGSTSLGLQTSVTNPVTRHPAVTATSAMTVQKLSEGRMILGIGRGDSALAHLGRAPARLRWFENYLVNVQAYLRGDEVGFDATGISDEVAPPVKSLELADTPQTSSIHWAKNIDKVPVEVAATGAKVIGIAARHADRIMFALGAQPERISWGIEIARKAAQDFGRDPDSLAYGAYVNLVCHDDMKIARQLGRASTSLFARFSVMHGQISGPTDDRQAEVFRNIHDTYDMNAHAQAGGQQTKALTDEFMDRYAIIGSIDECVARLSALAELGVNKYSVAGPNFASKSDSAKEAAELFEGSVMPQLRSD